MAFNSFPNVTSLAGTVNQVNVSAAQGAVTLSLPQSIHTAANVTFGSVNDISLSKTPSGWTITGGDTPKTLTLSNSITVAGTDGSTLNIGSGGALGTNAFTSFAAVPAITTVNGKPLTGNITLTTSDLGASAIGANLFSLASTGAVNYLKVNADNTISTRTAAQLKSDLALTPGTDVQPYNANLTSLAAASTTNSLYYKDGSGNWVPVSIGTNISFSAGTISASGAAPGIVSTSGSPSSGNIVVFSGSTVITNGNLSGDVTTSGALVTTLNNIPAATTVAGRLLATAVVAPATPSAGVGAIYVDSTSKNLTHKNDAGAITVGVKTLTPTTSNWIRGISSDGTITTSQPAFSDVSGSITNAQIPATLSSKVIDDTNTITVKDGGLILENTTTPSKKLIFDLSAISTSTTRTMGIPNANSTSVVPDVGASNQFLTGISSAGVITRAQPTFSNIGGSVTGSQMPALTGDVVTSAGATVTTITNIPNAVTLAGRLVATAVVAPATPSAGVGAIYVDSTSKNLSVKDDAGVVKHGVQTQSAVGSQWIRSISDAGAITLSQPAFSDVSGVAVNNQMPAILSSKTFDNSNTYAAKDGSFTLENTTTGTKKAVFDLSNIGAVQTRTVNIPNANSTTIQPSTLSASNWVTGVSSQGVLTGSQPAFSDISGVTTNAQTPPGFFGKTLSTSTLDATNTYAVKDGSFTVQNTTTASKQAVFDLSNIGISTTRTVNIPNANSTTIQPNTGASNNFLTGISAQGVITTAQPTFANISGVATNSQMPAILSSKTLDSSNVIVVKSDSITLQDATDTTKQFIFDATGISAGAIRTLKVANGTSTTVLPDTGASNNFLTGVNSSGVITKAQPSFSNIAGSVTGSQLPALTGNVTTSAGSAVTTLANIPTAVPADGYIAFTAIAAPGTPGAGIGRIYVDSTSKNWSVKNDAGVVNHGVQTQAATGSNWIRSIADTGAVTISQPAFSDVSGVAVNNQMPPILSSKTFDNSNTYVAKSGNLTLQDGTDTTKQAIFGLSNIAAGQTRTVNVPNANSTTIQPATLSASNYITGISAQGVITGAQPAFSDISGGLVNGQLPSTISSKTFDDTNSYTIKDGSLILENTATPTKKAVFDLTNIAGGATRTVNVPNANSTTVQPTTALGSQWLTGVSAQGVLLASQPAFSDISGAILNAQVPATLSSKTLDNTNTLNIKDGSFTLENTATGSKKAVFDLTNIGAGTTRTVNVPNANSTTVQPGFIVSSQWVTGISAQGVITISQPLFSDISGVATNGQLPSTISSKVFTSDSEFHVRDSAFTIEQSGDPSTNLVFDLSNLAASSNRAIRVADGNSVTVLPDPGSSNNFITGINSTGTITKAQPSFANISGVATNGQLPSTITSKTFDNTNSFTINDGSLELRNTAATSKKANFDLSGISLGATRTISVPNANSTAVVPNTGASNNFLTGISALGVVSTAQPAFSNLSGTATVAQGGTGSGTAAGARANLFTLTGNAGKTLYVKTDESDVVAVAAYRKVNVQVLTTSGTYTPTAGTTEIFVECIGGGGGGGGGATASSNLAVGAGGGGGGYANKWITSPSASYSYTIGAGGNGGTGGSGGASGGATIFGTSLCATSAASGGGVISAGTSQIATQGGPGGGASFGDVKILGAPGHVAYRQSGTFGISGQGGSSGKGFGSGGQELVNATSANGNVGTGYGGGGGGALTTSTQQTGGKGADGVIIVTEYYSTTNAEPSLG